MRRWLLLMLAAVTGPLAAQRLPGEKLGVFSTFSSTPSAPVDWMDPSGVSFNVRDYGAKCDNVNDDTAGFQAAVNAANAGYVTGGQQNQTGVGRVIFVPAGTCRLSKTIVFPTNLVLRGEGFNSLIQWVGGGSTRMFQGGTGNQWDQGVWFESLFLYGALANANANIDAIYFNGMSFGGVRNTLIWGFTGRGIVQDAGTVGFNNAYFNHYENVAIRACTNNAGTRVGTGIAFVGGGGTNAQGNQNYIHNLFVDTCAQGIVQSDSGFSNVFWAVTVQSTLNDGILLTGPNTTLIAPMIENSAGTNGINIAGHATNVAVFMPTFVSTFPTNRINIAATAIGVRLYGFQATHGGTASADYIGVTGIPSNNASWAQQIGAYSGGTLYANNDAIQWQKAATDTVGDGGITEDGSRNLQLATNGLFRETIDVNGNVVAHTSLRAAGFLRDSAVALSCGSATTPALDASTGNYFTCNITGNVAVTVAVPTNAPAAGQSQTITVALRNGSGGALTTAPTFNGGAGGFKFSAVTNPTNGTQVAYTFRYDPVQSFWYEIGSHASAF